MSFPVARLLKTLQSDKPTEEISVECRKPVKRSCPFSNIREEQEEIVVPEAVDIMNDIFSSICSISDDDENSCKSKSPVGAKSEAFVEQDISDVPGNHDNLKYDERRDMDGCETETNEFPDPFDFEKIPVQVTGAWKEFEKQNVNNFTKGCKWAPDGSCILTCSDDNTLRLFNLPQEVWDTSQWQDISEMEAVLRIQEGELTYDYCWYPPMNSSDPCSSCFISCSRNKPVHLWDAFTGELRCSYRSFDHVDELASPHSLSFDTDGQHIFCGFEKIVRVFDISLPGRSFEERKLYAKKSGQHGIISCFAFTPTNRNISVAGSYNRSIGIYSEPGGSLECILEGQQGGVTQVQFSPDGNLLYSGGRKDPEILCWDMRNLGEVLYTLRRSCTTNQRMYFDITSCGKYVISGNQNGVITIWDTTQQPKEVSLEQFTILEPKLFYLAHKTCVNGISIHPTLPLLSSSSGQRVFADICESDENMFTFHDYKTLDNSLRLWWIGKFGLDN